MTSKNTPSWLPKRGSSKVELPSKYQFQIKSSRIKDRVNATAKDPDFMPETISFYEDESDKNANPVAIETP